MWGAGKVACYSAMGFDRCKVSHPPLLDHTENWFHCLEVSWLHLFCRPAPRTLGTCDLFTVSILLPFPDCDMNRIIQYGAFSDWLLSLDNTDLGFLPVVAGLRSSFRFIAE